MANVKYNWKSGQIFGSLMLTGKSCIVNKNRLVEYICECGKVGWTRIAHLISGLSKSCGCVVGEISRVRETTHGLSKHNLYGVWNAMKQRCYDENTIAYAGYGGRGVTVCQEWKDSFESFYGWAIKNGYEKGLELDKDKKSPFKTGIIYSPEYCCFLTTKENTRHRSTTRLITYNGEEKSLAEWSDLTGLCGTTILNRLNKNWPMDEVFSAKKYFR